MYINPWLTSTAKILVQASLHDEFWDMIQEIIPTKIVSIQGVNSVDCSYYIYTVHGHNLPKSAWIQPMFSQVNGKCVFNGWMVDNHVLTSQWQKPDDRQPRRGI